MGEVILLTCSVCDRPLRTLDEVAAGHHIPACRELQAMFDRELERVRILAEAAGMVKRP